MTAWDQCTVCQKPTTSGLLVCFACAARMIELQQKARVPVREVIVEDGYHARVRGHVVPCPACREPMEWVKDQWSCSACGYKETDG